ncbi:MAG: hypothetical protein R3F27_09355 [Gammaproteobacteria bacterium]
MNRILLLIGLVAVLLVSACTPAQQAPAPSAADSAPLPATGSQPSAAESVAATPAADDGPAPLAPEAVRPETVKEAPVTKPEAAPRAAVAVPAPAPASPPPAAVKPKPAAPAARAAVPAAEPVQASRPPPVVAAPPAAPPLDLAGLEARLRETKAIGVMTKLALKNQVDDLLDAFRSQYRGRSKTPLPELRAAYDRLLMKVLSLLQDGDPALAKKIVSSREAIWDILSDPKKFSENNLMAGA